MDSLEFIGRKSNKITPPVGRSLVLRGGDYNSIASISGFPFQTFERPAATVYYSI